MSIRDNVAAGLRLGACAARDARRGRRASLEAANLWDEVKDRLGKPGAACPVASSSGCASPCHRVQPDVLLMDEPCSALDPISTLAIEDLMFKLERDYTIVVVTHNMQQAARVSDGPRLQRWSGSGEPGRLIEVGETAKIFTNPITNVTEAYITGRFG